MRPKEGAIKKILLVAAVFIVSLGIAQQASINVTSPNGGENWALGSTHNITWRSSGLAENVMILLFSGGIASA